MELESKILEKISLFNKEIETASDRACAIVCAAFLDDLMQELLLEFLCDDSNTQNNKLFNQNGPLATFSSKIFFSVQIGAYW